MWKACLVLLAVSGLVACEGVECPAGTVAAGAACTPVTRDASTTSEDPATTAPEDGNAPTGEDAGMTPASSMEAGAAPCSRDTECVGAELPDAEPTGCATMACRNGQCVPVAADADEDGFAAAACELADGTPIELGDDCDDGDGRRYPGAWDGPEDPTDEQRPNRCDDGVDYDCSGTPADGTVSTESGEVSCRCEQGETIDCKEDEMGQVIAGLAGNEGTCQLGRRTCNSDGGWGACVGAVGPSTRDCNSPADNNCDGAPDNLRDQQCQCAGDETSACTGDNNCPGTRNCTNHRWGACEAPASCDCTPGLEQTCSGGPNNCPGGSQTCGDNRRWSDCEGAPPYCQCSETDTRPCASLEGAQPCGSAVCAAGQWDLTSCEGPLVLYVDGDGDSFGGAQRLGECTVIEGTVTRGGDCNDSLPDINPGADEVCDMAEVDENCAGGNNENCDCYLLPAPQSRPCAETSGVCAEDGIQTCEGTGTWSACSITPSEELCDGRDNDCDGTPDNADADNDGIPDCADNCPNLANPEQVDVDEDGIGLACDRIIRIPDEIAEQIFDLPGGVSARVLLSARGGTTVMEVREATYAGSDPAQLVAATFDREELLLENDYGITLIDHPRGDYLSPWAESATPFITADGTVWLSEEAELGRRRGQILERFEGTASWTTTHDGQDILRLLNGSTDILRWSNRQISALFSDVAYGAVFRGQSGTYFEVQPQGTDYELHALQSDGTATRLLFGADSIQRKGEDLFCWTSMESQSVGRFSQGVEWSYSMDAALDCNAVNVMETPSGAVWTTYQADNGDWNYSRNGQPKPAGVFGTGDIDAVFELESEAYVRIGRNLLLVGDRMLVGRPPELAAAPAASFVRNEQLLAIVNENGAASDDEAIVRVSVLREGEHRVVEFGVGEQIAATPQAEISGSGAIWLSTRSRTSNLNWLHGLWFHDRVVGVVTALPNSEAEIGFTASGVSSLFSRDGAFYVGGEGGRVAELTRVVQDGVEMGRPAISGPHRTLLEDQAGQAIVSWTKPDGNTQIGTWRGGVLRTSATLASIDGLDSPTVIVSKDGVAWIRFGEEATASLASFENGYPVVRRQVTGSYTIRGGAGLVVERSPESAAILRLEGQDARVLHSAASIAETPFGAVLDDGYGGTRFCAWEAVEGECLKLPDGAVFMGSPSQDREGKNLVGAVRGSEGYYIYRAPIL